MSFDWKNFLILAEELAGRSDTASKRTAISRAYYFVFNIAFIRATLTTGDYPRDESFHNWCWTKYRSSPVIECQRLAVAGERMKAARVKADYSPADISRLDDLVQRMLADARQFEMDIGTLNPRYPLR